VTLRPLLRSGALLTSLFAWAATITGAQDGRTTEGVVAVDGANIYYRSIGAGPPLLLVHGYHNAGQVWEPYVDSLKTRYRLISSNAGSQCEPSNIACSSVPDAG